MGLGNCSNEINDCDLGSMTFEQLFRKLLRKNGDCLSLSTGSVYGSQRDVTRTLDNTVHSSFVEAGARSVSIETSSDFTGTILGVSAQPDRVYDFADIDTIGEIDYKITSGSIIITKIV